VTDVLDKIGMELVVPSAPEIPSAPGEGADEVIAGIVDMLSELDGLREALCEAQERALAEEQAVTSRYDNLSQQILDRMG